MATYRTVSGKYRDPYRRGHKHGLKPVLIKAGEACRFVTLLARESATDWNGSYYTNQVAEFTGMANGWRWQDTVYPTLLRAVRAALQAGVR